MENNKTAIITGATGGIGRATAMKFAANHFNLTLVDQQAETLQQLADEIANAYATKCLVCAGDLADMDFLQYVMNRSQQTWISLDVLVNNAAWRTIETMRTMEAEVWERTLRVCLTAPAFLSKYFANILEQQSRQGVIINISSVMSERAAGYSPAYTCAKGAMESLTRELAVTYGRSGIRVNSISPGFIDTEMSSDYTNDSGRNTSAAIANDLLGSIPLARPGGPEEIASAIFWLASSEASYITGTNLLIDGGLKHNFNDYAIKKLQLPQEF